jgi:hypothetical protein
MKRPFVELLSHSHTQDTTVALHLPLYVDGNKKTFPKHCSFYIKNSRTGKSPETVLDNVRSPTSNFKICLELVYIAAVYFFYDIHPVYGD